MGFALLRDGGDFVELTWENHRLFLAELSALQGVLHVELAAAPKFPPANVRVMVPNVDDYWSLANQIAEPIIVPIGDRYCVISPSLIRTALVSGLRPFCRPEKI